MNEKNTGGAAFPRPFSSSPTGRTMFEKQDGMNLRDWFAGKAMDHALSHFPCEIWNQSQGGLSGTEYIDAAARSAYAIADAMLRARGDA